MGDTIPFTEKARTAQLNESLRRPYTSVLPFRALGKMMGLTHLVFSPMRYKREKTLRLSPRLPSSHERQYPKIYPLPNSASACFWAYSGSSPRPGGHTGSRVKHTVYKCYHRFLKIARRIPGKFLRKTIQFPHRIFYRFCKFPVSFFSMLLI